MPAKLSVDDRIRRIRAQKKALEKQVQHLNNLAAMHEGRAAALERQLSDMAGRRDESLARLVKLAADADKAAKTASDARGMLEASHRLNLWLSRRILELRAELRQARK